MKYKSILTSSIALAISCNASLAEFNPDVNGGISVVLDNESVDLGAGDVLIGSENGGNSLSLINGAILRSSGAVYFSKRPNDDNRINITGGSQFIVSSFRVSSAFYSEKGIVEISGKGSLIYLTSGRTPSSTSMEVGIKNIFNISDGGLLKLGASMSCPAYAPYSTVNIRLDGGYVVIGGQYSIEGGINDGYKTNFGWSQYSYYDEENANWSIVSSYEEFKEYFELNYYATDEEGYNAIGIDGLGGYTVVSAKLIPEISAYGVIAGIAIAFCVRFRRAR